MLITDGFSLVFSLLPFLVLFLTLWTSAQRQNQLQAQRRQQLQLESQNAFATAQQQFPGELIALDEQVSFAEIDPDPVMVGRAQAAREHLNGAFKAYRQHFGDDATPGNVAVARDEVAHRLYATRQSLAGEPVRPMQIAAPTGRQLALRQAPMAPHPQVMMFGLSPLTLLLGGLALAAGGPRRRVW